MFKYCFVIVIVLFVCLFVFYFLFLLLIFNYYLVWPIFQFFLQAQIKAQMPSSFGPKPTRAVPADQPFALLTCMASASRRPTSAPNQVSAWPPSNFCFPICMAYFHPRVCTSPGFPSLRRTKFLSPDHLQITSRSPPATRQGPPSLLQCTQRTLARPSSSWPFACQSQLDQPVHAPTRLFAAATTTAWQIHCSRRTQASLMSLPSPLQTPATRTSHHQ